MSLETRAIIELVNQGHLPPLCLNQKTPKRKDITMQVTEKHSHAEHERVIRERYMLCCDCGDAYKETKIFKKAYQSTSICLCRKCATKLAREIESNYNIDSAHFGD